MSTIAISSVMMAITHEAGWSPEGGVSRVVSFHDVYTATGSASAGPALAFGATGFLLQGVSGSTLVRRGGTAVDPSNTPDQVLVMQGERVYLPAKAGETLSLLQLP